MAPILSVVVPVYNGGPSIVENIETIRAAIAGPLGHDPFEIVVVSDGSIDGTAERLLRERLEGVRVIHYDRNLGKGYAVKAGILASHGEWIGLCDSDLDLDPASLPVYLSVARRERLDLAIGSKRHPESVVHYPFSRRLGSWGYQQLNRLLFGLHVRDTQVGLKVMSRGVADQVVPLLLVKQFAFDLELLAVARALRFDRVRELPVRLDYRFTGSGVGSRAVARALWDTAAIFYRLRILRTYQRKQGMLHDTPRAVAYTPRVSLVEAAAGAELDYPLLDRTGWESGQAAEIVARLRPGSRAAGNWIVASVQYLADPSVAAVVCPTVAPLEGTIRELAGAAVLESRMGGGSRRVRSVPGNLRVVRDFPAESVVIRKSDLDASRLDDIRADELVVWLAERGRNTVYTPETVVVARPPAAVLPLVRLVTRDARSRGRAARITRGSSLGLGTALSLLPVGCAAVGLPLLLFAGTARSIGVTLLVLYGLALVASATFSGMRFRSLGVGLLVVPSLVVAQLAYVAGFVRGVVGPTARARQGQA